MFKFFRKYNKYILAIGGTLLLIVFLIPQAITALSQQSALHTASVATVGQNESISLVEWDRVRSELVVLDRLNLQVPGFGLIRSPEHWYLLTREAAQAGLIADVNLFGDARELARQAAQVGVQPSVLRNTLNKFTGVNQLVSLYVGAGQFSDYRLKAEAARLFHQADIEAVLINADPEATEYEPSEDEMREQFEKYADVEPGEGEMGFGYRLPSRVKLEWLMVDAEQVRQSLEEDPTVTEVTIRKFWRQNEGQPNFPPVSANDDVPATVRDRYFDQRLERRLEDIERFGYDALRRPQRQLSKEDGYLILPEDWQEQRLGLQDLAERIRDRFNIPLPEYHARGDQWLAADEVQQLEDVGRATTPRFGRSMSLSQLVQAAREFDTESGIPIQEDVAGPPLRDPDQSLYFFRILDTDPARPAETVDEVREQIVTDLKRKAHYEQLLAQDDAILRTARDEGMLATALDYDGVLLSDLNVSLYDRPLFNFQRQVGQPLTATPTQIQGLGQNEEVVGQIIDYVRSLPTDAAISELPEDQRTFLVPVDDNTAILVVRVSGTRPFTAETYEQLLAANQLQSVLLDLEFRDREAIEEAFGFEALKERHNFELTRQQEDEGQPTA